MDIIITSIAAYLLGAVPFGYLLTRLFKREDIRRHGSGNIGATNVMRLMGWKIALLVFILDVAKGAGAVLLARLYSGEPSIYLLAGFAVILGHSFPVFLGFRGGKGAATGLGVLFALAGPVTFLVLLVFVLSLALTRYVSLGSILAALSIPVFLWVFEFQQSYIYFGLAMAIFIVLRHYTNISRLISGTENKFTLKKTGKGKE